MCPGFTDFDKSISVFVQRNVDLTGRIYRHFLSAILMRSYRIFIIFMSLAHAGYKLRFLSPYFCAGSPTGIFR